MYLAKMEMNHQNCQIINKNSNEMVKWALWKVEILAKMEYLAKMAMNRQNQQSLNKNSNDMAKGPFESANFGGNGHYSMKYLICKEKFEMKLQRVPSGMAINCQIVNHILI